MRRIAYFVLLIMACGFFLGCANTIKGMGEDIRGIGSSAKSVWSTLNKWDANFKKNWW